MEPHRFEKGQPMLLAGVRRHHATVTAATTVVEQWRDFLSIVPIPGRVGTHYYGAMCGGDRSGFEYLTGVEVASFEHLPRGLGRMRVPAQHYAVFRHPAGAVLGSTWQAIMAWLSGGRYESAHLPDFERYETAPESLSPQPNIELWVGVVDRGVR